MTFSVAAYYSDSNLLCLWVFPSSFFFIIFSFIFTFFIDYIYPTSLLHYVSIQPTSDREPDFCHQPPSPVSRHAQGYASYLNAL